MAKKDDVDAAFYDNEEALRPAGHARAVRAKSSPKPLSSHVPIRFDGETIAEIKRISDEDGVTVSTWIRKIVSREVERRQERPKTQPTMELLTFDYSGHGASVVTARHEPDIEIVPAAFSMYR